MHGNPLVLVLSVRQPYGSSEVARALEIQREASATSALGEGRDAQERGARGQLLTADTHKGRLCELLELVLLGSRGCLLGLKGCERWRGGSGIASSDEGRVAWARRDALLVRFELL